MIPAVRKQRQVGLLEFKVNLLSIANPTTARAI